MLLDDQIDEAVELIDEMLDWLQASVKSSTGREAYKLRSTVGDLRANCEQSIKSSTIGNDIRECFDAAVEAGAIPEGLEAVRRYLVDFDYRGDIALSIGGHSILICISAICIRGSLTVYKSQDDVQSIIIRIQEILQHAKDLVADEMPVAIYNHLNYLASSTTRHLARTKLQLPRVVQYKVRASLPSLTLSNMIFRTGTRSEEIVDENKIVHPAFCLRELRVLSK